MLDQLRELVTPTSVLVGLVCGLLVYQLTKKRYKLPPAPFEWPLIGNIELMRSEFWFSKFDEYTKTLGPVFRIQLGPNRMVILNDLKSVKEALITRSADFANRMTTTITYEISEGMKDIVFANYTPAWKLHRKLASKAFRQYLKRDHLNDVIEDCMSKVIAEMKKKSEPFNPQQLIDYGVFNISCSLCFNTRYDLTDPVFIRLMKEDYELVDTAGNGLFEDLFPYLRHVFPTKAYTRVMQGLGFVVDFFAKEVEKHWEAFDPNNIQDFTDNLLLARKEAEAEENEEELAKITDVHIRQTLIDLFFAGIDTTRFTLYWTFLYLIAYPEIQKKCQEEIDSVVSSSRLPSTKDKEHLCFVEATVHEAMRIRTVAPIGVPHAARLDSKIGEFDIPKGMAVCINHWALHMNPEYWPEPDKFDPCRFLDADGKLTPKPDAWLPFSAGRRVCLGETLAKPELVLIVSTLLQKFTFSVPEGETVDLTPAGTMFSVTPKEYNIVAKPRF